MYFFLHRLVQSIFLLPRYLERNHELLTKTLAKHSISEEELKAYEEEERRAQAETAGNVLDQPVDSEEVKKTK